MKNFEGIKHFDPKSAVDQWGDASKIDATLLKYLDAFRAEIGHPVIITSGFRPGNASSQHATGKAVDIVVPSWSKGLIELFLIAERYPFTGIGIYPQWSYNHSVVGGLHLDVRSLTNSRAARWIGVPDKVTKKQEYKPLSFENLKAFNVI